jgi:hypothetical protein
MSSSLSEAFSVFDNLDREVGFQRAIDAANLVVATADLAVSKAAALGDPVSIPSDEVLDARTNPLVKSFGALAQMWKDPSLSGIPQRPSSLGQALVLGGLGTLGGYGIGKLVDRVIPNDAVKASRAGAILGGMLGVSPALASAYLNSQSGQPVWTSSAWDTRKSAHFGTDPYAVAAINVNDFQNAMWSDPRIVNEVPLSIRAAASGVVQGAANLPGKSRNSSFVTPFDIARVAVGMGTGLASGWLVGKTLGAVFGTGKKTQELLRNTGVAVGALRTAVPLTFGSEPYSF